MTEECYASLECRVVDTRMAAKYGFFVLQVLKAWLAPTVKQPRTLHHCGSGRFRGVGESLDLASKMK